MGLSVRNDTSNYLSLFLQDVPLMDVRAPVEFALGAFPGAVNCPLLDDRQREQIGTRYREQGMEAAIALGHTLATPELRAARLAQWQAFCSAHPDGYLYCFRGGLRSHTVQQWLREAGVDYPLVQGGYKALRGFLLQQFGSCLDSLQLLVLGGRTGSGKTALLHCAPHVDLEGLARHRGSAFGSLPQPQPAQISWENAVAVALLRHRHGQAPQLPLLLEDESRLIGRIHVPPGLQRALQQAPLVVLETPLEQRVAAICRDYVEIPWRQFQQQFDPDTAGARFRAHILDNLARIRKRLGEQRHHLLHASFSRALDGLLLHGSSAAFAPGIRQLLSEYYDPMYDHLLTKRQGLIVFRGSQDEVSAWLRNRQDISA